jgi:hypothetical protein
MASFETKDPLYSPFLACIIYFFFFCAAELLFWEVILSDEDTGWYAFSFIQCVIDFFVFFFFFFWGVFGCHGNIWVGN